eukprot:1049228-Rhodomonas_salina.1
MESDGDGEGRREGGKEGGKQGEEEGLRKRWREGERAGGRRAVSVPHIEQQHHHTLSQYRTSHAIRYSRTAHRTPFATPVPHIANHMLLQYRTLSTRDAAGRPDGEREEEEAMETEERGREGRRGGGDEREEEGRRRRRRRGREEKRRRERVVVRSPIAAMRCPLLR